MNPRDTQELEVILGKLFDKNQDSVSAILKRIDDEERRRITRELSGSLEVRDDADAGDIDIKIRTLITLCVVLTDNELAMRTVSDNGESDGVLHGLFTSLYELSKAASSYPVSPRLRVRYALLASIAAVTADKHSEVSPFAHEFLELNINNEVSFDNDISKLQYEIEILLLELIIVIRSNQDKERLVAKLQACRDSFDRLQNRPFEVSTDEAVRIHQIAAVGNLLYIIDATLTFMFTGTTDSGDDIRTVLDSYSYNAISLYRMTHSLDDENLVYLVRLLLEQFSRNSVWNIADRSPIFTTFFRKCMESSGNVLYTLLPPQRDKILDLLTVKKSIVVNMPTSAGKSLLAELYILFTLYNNANDDNPPVVCYLVPTNALINQVKHRLSKVFNGLDYSVDGVLPFYDIDPIEDEILKRKHIHVIVSTPEKMDSLIRQDHPAVKNLRLIVLDEAHNIADKERGAKMELLLSIVKRRKKDARFLLLSPFIGNSNEISKWLGDTEQDSLSIQYEWTPTKQYVGATQVQLSGRKISAKYLPSGRDGLIKDDLEVEIYHEASAIEMNNGMPSGRTDASLIKIASTYSKIGTTLIICNGIPTVQKLAHQLYQYLSAQGMPEINNDKVSDVINLVKLELGEESLLATLLAYGIAYHHSQLPAIVKEEVEDLIREGFVKYIYATTTLAQGMNFPITTVIFRDLRMGGGSDGRNIDNSLFWNIAGRAGRAYMDTEGHILLLHKSSLTQTSVVEKAKDYIRKDLLDIESSLKIFFESFSSDVKLDYALLKKDTAISSFLQYLNHLIRISHNYDFQAVDLIKIRGMLSNSLVFNQIRIEEGFLESQQQITSFARTYVNQISSKSVGQLKLADLLGISDISLSKFYSEMARLKEDLLSEFGPDATEKMKASKLILDSKDSVIFSRVVDILASIPELKVFIDGRGTLDSKSIADIVIGWVNGRSINDIASEIRRDGQSLEDAIGLCHRYINGRLKTFVPWGVSIYQNLTDDVSEDRSKSLPSYIYFGVKDNNSVILSTAGVPRFALGEVSRIYKREYGEQALSPQDIDTIKSRLKSLDYSTISIPNIDAGAVAKLVKKYTQ